MLAAADRHEVIALGPWRLVFRRLRRDRIAVGALALFLLLVTLCFGAPIYARHFAERGPNDTNVTGTVVRGGRRVDVVSREGMPIGPALDRRYMLGADATGRDVAVRVLYGGRNSLAVSFTAALITTVLAAALGLLSGYYRGRTDTVIRTLFDLVWSFPALLLAIALSTALAVGGLQIGPLTIPGNSLWIPILVLSITFVPYVGRPLRSQVLSLREREFVLAAQAQGMGPMRIMFREILPNLMSTVIVLSTLIVATDILTEAGLSFLGVGVQPPDPSWGNLIADGLQRLVTAPHLVIIPGVAIFLTVLALNLFGDGLREALDPKAPSRLR